MATRIKSYISTSVDITQASAPDVSRADALQALNQIFSPKVVVWWQPKADPKVHYLAVFETAEAAKEALNTQHHGWAVASLNDAGKRALGLSLEKTIKLYPNTFRRARAGKGVTNGQPRKTALPQMHQTTPAAASNLPVLTPAPLPVSQPPPTPTTFPAPQHDTPQVAVAATTPSTIDAVVDQANSVEKAIRALVSQKELVFQQRNQLLLRTRELEQGLNSSQEENTGLREKMTRQEEEKERLQAIIDSQPPPPVTRDAAVDASSQDNETIPPAVAAELKELCLVLVQKDMILAEKERNTQEMSRTLEEEVGKRKAAEEERDRLIAERDRERARIPAVLDLYAELERMAVESLDKRENKGKAKDVS